MKQRMILLFLCAAAMILLPTYFIVSPTTVSKRLADEQDLDFRLLAVQEDEGQDLGSNVIMPKMKNETAKAELGRAGWKLLHTMGERYPDHPTEDERQTFKDFLHLFSRMYPCGECASHFQQMLKEYPPQTSSKNTVSLYLCMLHNKVNVRLKKEEFDCTKLKGLYDCGCGEESSTAAISQITKKAGIIVHPPSDHPPPLHVDPITGEELVHG